MAPGVMQIAHGAPFWVAGAMALVNVIYGWFVLPESLDAQHRRAFEWKRANPLGALLTRRHVALPRLGGADPPTCRPVP